MVKLGLDMFSLRSQNWTPEQQLAFCARWGVQVVHYSEPWLIGGLDVDHLAAVKARADALGIAIEFGMLSICPSSGIFKPALGSAEDQIASALEAARVVGSPFVRCVVGTLDDRRRSGPAGEPLGPGSPKGSRGIEARIDDTLAVLKRVRSRVLDAGLKLAIENHAGDLQARELKGLVEAAGTDFVGVCIDAGNALWAIEDPHLTLETLAPYVLTSHTRDTAVWSVAEGAAVAWTRMGEGNVGIEDYLRAFINRCPDRTLMLEIIVVPEPRIMRYHAPEFWDAYRDMPAWEFERFLSLVATGSPRRPDPEAATPAREVADVEASLTWTKAALQRIGN